MEFLCQTFLQFRERPTASVDLGNVATRETLPSNVSAVKTVEIQQQQKIRKIVIISFGSTKFLRYYPTGCMQLVYLNLHVYHKNQRFFM